MQYDFFFDEERNIIKGIFDESINLPPAIRDYGAALVAQVSRNMFNNMYPSASQEDWLDAWTTKSELVNVRKYQQGVRDTPLSSIKGFTNVQEKMDISSWTYNNRPLRSYFGQKEWDAYLRGEQQFKGLQTVGQLQSFIANSTLSGILALGSTERGQRRGQHSPLRNLGQMFQTVMEQMPYYDPGTDIVQGDQRPERRSYPFFLSRAMKSLNTLIDPVANKEAGADVFSAGQIASGLDVSNLTVREQFAEPFFARVKPVPGQGGAYEITGMFTRTGRPFVDEKSWQLEKTSLTPREGWKPIVVNEADALRFDRLFAHTANQGQPQGLGYNAYKSNRPVIDMYRGYFGDVARDLSLEGGSIGYAPDDYIEPIVSRNRVYNQMPRGGIYTGQYYLNAKSLETSPIFYGTNQAGQTYNRSAMTLSSDQIRFLLGDYTHEDLQRNPGMVKYDPKAINPAFLPKEIGGKATGWNDPQARNDPFFFQRREAARIFRTYESVLTTLPASTPTLSNMSQFEAEIISRENEQLNQGMTLQHQDAWGMSRPLQRTHMWMNTGQNINAPTLAQRMAIDLNRGVMPNIAYNPSRYLPQQYVTGGEVQRGYVNLNNMQPLTPSWEGAVNAPYSKNFPLYGRAQVELGTGLFRRESGVYLPPLQHENDPRRQGSQYLLNPDYRGIDRPRFDRATGLVLPMNKSYMAQNIDPKTGYEFDPWSKARWDYDEGPATTYGAIGRGWRTATTRWAWENDWYSPNVGGRERQRLLPPDPLGRKIITPEQRMNVWGMGPYQSEEAYGGWEDKDFSGDDARIRYENARRWYNWALGTGDKDIITEAKTQLDIRLSRWEEWDRKHTDLQGLQRSGRNIYLPEITKLREGDIFSITSGKKRDELGEYGGRSRSLRVTRAARLIDPRYTGDMEDWSQKEGWDTGYGNFIFGKRGAGYQIEFELARNPRFPNIAVARVARASIPGMLTREGPYTPTVPTPDRGVTRGAVGFQGAILLGGTGDVLKDKSTYEDQHFQVEDQQIISRQQQMGRLLEYVTGRAGQMLDPYTMATVATINLHSDPKSHLQGRNINYLSSKALLQSADYFMSHARRDTPRKFYADPTISPSGFIEKPLGEMPDYIRQQAVGIASRLGSELKGGGVELAPAPDPKHAEHKIRVSSNPAWYVETFNEGINKSQLLRAIERIEMGVDIPKSNERALPRIKGMIYGEIFHGEVAGETANLLSDDMPNLPNFTAMLDFNMEEDAVKYYQEILRSPMVDSDDIVNIVGGRENLDKLNELAAQKLRNARAYKTDPRPKQETRTANTYMQSVEKRIRKVEYLARRRTEVKFGGEAIKSRKIEDVPVPPDVLPEEVAFAGTAAKGVAIGEYGYIRGDFLTMEQLTKKYTGRELLQNAYQVGRIAASHEIGHIVFSKLEEGTQRKFSNLFNFMVNHVGQKGMLSSNVKPENFTFSEEFSAAYSIAATLGSDALKDFYPEYTKYFADNWEEIEKAEAGTRVIYYKGDKNAKAYRAKQLDVLGELPPDPNDLQATQLSFNQWLDDDTWGVDRTSQAGFLRDNLAKQYPMISGSSMPSAMAEARAVSLLESVGRDKTQWLKWANSKLWQTGRSIDNYGRMMNVEEGYRGHEVMGSAKVKMFGIERGQQAVGVALAQGAAPTGQVEWTATMLERVNKWIEDTYKNAINQSQTHGERMAMESLKKVAKGVGESMLFEAAGISGEGGEAAALRQRVRNFAYGASGHVITDHDELMKSVRSDPGIRQMWQQGKITEDMLGGPSQILSYPGGGSVRVGGPGAPTRASRFNLWGGKAGALMYSSYIMRRMWSMISAPEFQGADEYGQYLGSMAGLQSVAMAQTLGPDAVPQLTQTDAGYVARQRSVQRWIQRGQYQQWGGIGEAAYAVSGGGEAFPRLMSGLKVAAGAGIVGSLAGSTLGYMGLAGGGSAFAGAGTFAALGGVLPALGIGIGAAIGLGTVGMEVYNAAMQPETPATWGGLARGLGNTWNYGVASYQVAQQQVAPFARGAANRNLLAMGRGLLSGVGIPGLSFDEQQVLEAMTPQGRAMLEYKGEPPMMRDIRNQIEAVNQATGEDEGQMMASVRLLARNLKGVPKNLADIGYDWAKVGLTVAEGTQAFTNLASQMGYTPGTSAYKGFWDNFNQVASTGDVVQFEKMMSRGQRVSQFGGQLAGYFSSGKEALRLTDKYDLTTAARMMPVQSLLGMAAASGVDADQVISYQVQSSWEGRANVREVTYDEAMADMAQRRTAMEINTIIAPTAQALIGSGFNPVMAPIAAEGLGYTSPSQAAAAGAWLQTANLYGQGYGRGAYATIAPIRNISNFQASIIPGMAEPALRSGVVGAMSALAGGMGANLSDQMAWSVGKGAGGNLAALSYLANRQVAGQRFVPANWRDRGASPQFQNQLTGIFDNPYQWMIQDQYGMSIGQTNFGAAMQFGAFWEQDLGGMPVGVASFQPAAQLAAAGDMTGAAEAFFTGAGVDFTPEDIQAWADGSIIARTAQYNQTMRGYRKQAANLAGAGAALSARALWGGGSWTGTPAPGSIWAIQDTLRSMGNRNQLSQFAYQREMMQTQNQFAVQQEQLQATRMDASQQYNRWQMGFQHMGMMQGRMWQRQDWQYQDTMRNMQFGWQMEDLDEAIRTSSGRQRSQLVRQRDRAATTYNLEGEKIDENRSRQEELWSQQDEQFSKQQEYQETMMQLDEEQFEMQKEQRQTLYEMEGKHFDEQVQYYKDRYAVETELIAKQRDYQAAQIALQGAQAALQKKMADETERYQTQVEEFQKPMTIIETAVKNTVENEPEKIFTSFSDLVVNMKSISGDHLGYYSDAFKEMKNVSTSTLYEIRRTMDAINGLSPTRLQQIAAAIWNIADATDGIPGH